MTADRLPGWKSRPRSPGPISFVGAALLLLLGACAREERDPTLLPDSLLRAELGLTDLDEVHRVVLLGGEAESATPAEVSISEGAWVEFVSGDWWVHEVRFELDSLSGPARSFLEGSDQVASPPIVNRGERYLVSFAGAPEHRYPFVLEGNGAEGRGVVVVAAKR